MKILVNDGISAKGVEAMENAGFEVLNINVSQNQLKNYINQNNIDVLLVRSATQVNEELIEACPSIKIIGRGGVGMDNIDVEYAREKGIEVINTPDASSRAVAELVFAHLLGMSRFLHETNRNMPMEGDTNFKGLKKAYSDGIELKGKTLGILGAGRIGKEVAKIAIAMGMKVIACDPYLEDFSVSLEFFDGKTLSFDINIISKEDLLKQSDFISLHIPAQEGYLISTNEFDLMKDNVILVNASRGGLVDEIALIKAIEDGKVLHAALDVFETEPTPEIQLLMNPSLSLSPHIGAATVEAQDRIGVDLAEQIIRISTDLI
ncbi:MAG: D-2-hydroxyacid dehydrogenase [Flavobacteriaceae bacterium]|nr:D-2-hydroxyacid dehydrogenase [Flavobacteriaceae bacterium]